ncbi:hypothetical protein L345_01143, partial [Ophiophagus hannah]
MREGRKEEGGREEDSGEGRKVGEEGKKEGREGGRKVGEEGGKTLRVRELMLRRQSVAAFPPLSRGRGLRVYTEPTPRPNVCVCTYKRPMEFPRQPRGYPVPKGFQGPQLLGTTFVGSHCESRVSFSLPDCDQSQRPRPLLSFPLRNKQTNKKKGKVRGGVWWEAGEAGQLVRGERGSGRRPKAGPAGPFHQVLP